MLEKANKKFAKCRPHGGKLDRPTFVSPMSYLSPNPPRWWFAPPLCVRKPLTPSFSSPKVQSLIKSIKPCCLSMWDITILSNFSNKIQFQWALWVSISHSPDYSFEHMNIQFRALLATENGNPLRSITFTK